MTTQLLADLRAVRELLTPPQNWIQGEYAHYASAKPNAKPIAFCLSFAICVVTGCLTPRELHVRQSVFATLPDGTSMLEWNDAPERTHAEVVAMLDETIKRVEGEGR